MKSREKIEKLINELTKKINRLDVNYQLNAISADAYTRLLSQREALYWTLED